MPPFRLGFYAAQRVTLFYVNCGLPHLRITKLCLSGPFGFSSQFTYRSDNGLNFQNEITDLYFNLAFAREGGELS